MKAWIGSSSAIVALWGAVALTAMQPAPSKPSLRAGIDVVTVTATVVDANGRLITGLPREEFTVFDDSEEQVITQFVRERVPVSLGILLDVSDSMTGKRMDEARMALDRFLVDLLDPEDEAFVGVFNHRPRVIAPWTLKPSQLRGSLDGVIPTGGTAIYDAINSSLPRFGQRAHQRAAIVVISDGADTASDVQLQDLRRTLRRSDAFVYAIAIDPPQKARINTAVDPAALRAITDDSGGFTEIVRDTSELGPATERIATELNSQYLIGYVSPHPDDGGYHSIRVRTKNPEYRVRSRKGYIGQRAAREGHLR
jgi:Ca-activated chloride channel family protein